MVAAHGTIRIILDTEELIREVNSVLFTFDDTIISVDILIDILISTISPAIRNKCADNYLLLKNSFISKTTSLIYFSSGDIYKMNDLSSWLCDTFVFKILQIAHTFKGIKDFNIRHHELIKSNIIIYL